MTYPTREDITKPIRKKPKPTPQISAKKKADAIFSKLVRAKGFCELCGRSEGVQLQCAHWLSRTFSNTRTDFDNAFCLCAGCHRAMTADPTAWADWTISQRGRATYERLREAANEKSKVWWPDEVVRLREIAKREGIAA